MGSRSSSATLQPRHGAQALILASLQVSIFSGAQEAGDKWSNTARSDRQAVNVLELICIAAVEQDLFW